MKLSNEKIINSISILRDISQKQLPIKASYKIAKNIKNINRELEVYDEERKKLIELHSQTDDNGEVATNESGNIVFKDEKSWKKDIEELLSIENDIEIHEFNIDDLEGCNMSPAELIAIDFMING